MEKGEYIRTQKGKIGKVANVWKSLASCRNETRYLIDWGNGKAHYIAKIKDLKHSKNIIDLIEVGDYVNNHKVVAVESKIKGELEVESQAFLGHFFISYDDIKTILTHEQYEQNCYKFKE